MNIMQRHGPNSPGILYQYKNQSEGMDILKGAPEDIAHRISDDLDERRQELAVVMVSVDEYWDVALLKFIYEFTSSSASQNVQEFRSSGLLEPHPGMNGIPRAATREIERMFVEIESGSPIGNPDFLKRELDRWGCSTFMRTAFSLYSDVGDCK